MSTARTATTGQDRLATTSLVTRAVTSWRPTMPGVTAMTAYLLSVVAANVTAIHWPPLIIGGLAVPAGTVFAGVCLTLRDLLHDALGRHGVAIAITVGAGLSFLLASPQIAVASVVAFTVSETFDALIYARLHHRTRLGAVMASNTAGLVIDSALFVPLAFGDFTAAPGQIMGKTLAPLLTLAALHGVGLARRGRRL